MLGVVNMNNLKTKYNLPTNNCNCRFRTEMLTKRKNYRLQL